MTRTILDINDIPRDRPLYLVGYPEVMESVSRNLRNNYYFNVRGEIDAFSDRPNHTHFNYTPDFRYFMRSFDGNGLLLICTREYKELMRRIAEFGNFECLDLWRYYREVAKTPTTGSWKTLTDYCLGPGSVVFDIGANNGIVSRYFAERAEVVYAFEPNTDLRESFRLHTAGQQNIRLENRAVSDQVGHHEFFVYEPAGTNAYGSSMQENSDYLERRQVPTTTIDGFCREEDVIPDFIKIDTEGHEPDVIKGGAEIISRFRPTIFFEYCEDTWAQLESTMRYLSRDYGLYRVDDGCRALDYYEVLSNLADPTIRSPLDSTTNILCLERRVPRKLSEHRLQHSSESLPSKRQTRAPAVANKHPNL